MDKEKASGNATQKNFVKGAALLGGLGLVCKIIGAVYTIITTNVVGTVGMAYYMTAFPIYTLLLFSCDVPISKMVSERVALGDYRAAHMVFQKALKAMILFGLITTVIMIAFSRPIAAALGRADASLTIMAIAPSLFFVAILSVYRGYFQGMQQMTPTAVSQVIEQIGKLVIGLAFAFLLIKKGELYAAAGSIFGITCSELLAFLYLVWLYNRRKRGLVKKIRRSVKTDLRTNLGRRLFYLAIPIIIGSSALPLMQIADTAIITNTLNSMKSIVLFGKEVLLNARTVDSLFSLLTGYVNPIINMPAVFSLALSISLVPAISASRAENDMLGVSKKSAMGLKLSMLIGLPCAVGLFLLSEPIIHLLFAGLKGDNLMTAGNILGLMAVAVFFLTILQTSTGILQGLGKTHLPVINLFIGLVVKISVSLVFIRIPEVNIQGASLGTIACYFVASMLDVICVIRHTRAKLKIMDNFVRPVLASASMGLIVYLMMPKGIAADSRPMTILTIIVAVASYVLFVILYGALTKDDLGYIPGGTRLASIMNRLHPPRKSTRRRREHTGE